MKEYEVIVTSKMVKITKTTDLINPHFVAVVDGEKYYYKVVNAKHESKPVAKWAFGRASVEIQYHAKNWGNYVRFEPVGRVKRKKKKKISPKQMTMFGDEL